jgi:surfactin synthase thioesterase subunit
MGGCPPEVLADRELLEFFEPILRADFQAFETWPVVSGPPIDVPIVVSRGSEDEVSEAAARAWALETRHPITYTEFAGGHFFILQHWAAIGSMIREHLKVAR